MTEIAIINAPELSINEQRIKDGMEALISKEPLLIINSQWDMEEAASLAKSCKSLGKKIDDIRKTKVQPFNDEVSKINSILKRGMIDLLIECSKRIESKMLKYTKDQEESARRKAEQDKEALFKQLSCADDVEGDDQVIHISNSSPSNTIIPSITRSNDGAVASIRKTWTFEVTNILELAICRPDLIEVSTTKINVEIRGENGNRDIPGLRIYQEEKIGVR